MLAGCAMLCLLSHCVPTSAHLTCMFFAQLLFVFIVPILTVLCYALFVFLVILSSSLSVIYSLLRESLRAHATNIVSPCTSLTVACNNQPMITF